MEIVLNPLSANCQCHSAEECFAAVSAYVDCCEYCWPALRAKRVKLLFDDHVEQRFLVGSENFLASIARCKGAKGGADLVKKWYLYTRNRSAVVPNESEVEIELKTNGIGSSVKGSVYKPLHDDISHWISFSGDVVCSANELIVSSSHGERTIRNCADIESFRTWLPRYEPNPKHRAKAYTAAGGEVVSPMPLSEAEAQELLLTSLSDNGGTRWAFHKETLKYYCFQRTHVDQEVFHGYVEAEEKVPNDLRDQLKT